MPSLNFKDQFAPKVKTLEKRCTIRAKRKLPIKTGDMLYLYTGMRTSMCRRLGTARCISVTPIRMWRDRRSGLREIKRGGQILSQDERLNLAKLDGFEDSFSFLNFFEENHGLPFEGDLITW